MLLSLLRSPRNFIFESPSRILLHHIFEINLNEGNQASPAVTNLPAGLFCVPACAKQLG